MKKLIALVIVAVMLLSMMPMVTLAAAPTTLYLKPNSNWTQGNAWFAARFWTDGVNGDAWEIMTDDDGDGTYECNVPNNHQKVIFCRMNPNGSDSSNNRLNWTNKWDQSGDQTIPTNGKNCFTVNNGQWNNAAGTWSTYTPSDSQTEREYYLTGADLVNSWDPNAQKLTNNGDGTYTYTVHVDSAGTYEYKVTNGTWNVAWPASGNNSVTTWCAGDILIKLDMNQSGGVVTATGDCVGQPSTELDYEFISVAGNGGDKSGWMNGAQYDPTANVNKMTEISEDVWEITFKNVPANEDYQLKFVKDGDGAWATNWGGTFTSSGTESVATYKPLDNITFSLAAVSNVVIKFDLTNYNAATHEGAKFTITITAVPVVTFNYNYTGAPTAPTATVDENGKVTAPTFVPSRPGWALEGWYTNTDCTGNKVDFATATFSENTTLYAKWVDNEHSVKFYLNNGTEDVYQTITTSGEKVVVPAEDPTRANYNFVKWNSKADGTGTTYEGDEAITENLELYAIWEQKPTFTINFNLNYEGATGAPAGKTTVDGKITLPADPTREGYTFNGWYDAATDGNKVDNGKVYTGNTTLYAQWTQIVKVTVYAKVPSSWTKCQIWAWGNGGDAFDTWSGPEMTLGSDGWYSIQVPNWVTGIILNDGGDACKTGDITVDENKDVWITVAEDKTTSVAYEKPAADDDDDEQGGGSVTPPPTTEMITVHAKVPTDWEAAYLYAWTTSPYKAWPGAAMAQGTEGWWTVEIPEGMANIIVSDGNGTQTVDLQNEDADIVWVVLGEKNPDGKYEADVTATKPSDFSDENAGNYVPPAAPTEFYLVGYINGADYYETTHKFVNGKLTITLTADSYAMIKDNNGDVYGTAAYCTEKTANMAIGGGEKMFVPKGEITFTLTVNADGTVKLSYTVPTPEGGNEGGEQGGTEGGNQSGTTGNPEVPAGSLIIHAKVPAAWASAYLYAWNTGDDVMASWPGTAMTKGDDGWYTIEIPAGYKNIIVAEKNGGEQTVDLSIANVTGNEIWVTLGEKNSDGKYPATIAEDEKGEEIVAPPEVKQITVYAKVPANWTTPYVYAWNGSGNNASWPGVAMTKGENGWWYAKVPATAENVIISNNGKTQTVDLKLEKLSVDAFVQVAAAGADGKYTATVQYSTNPDTGDTAIIAPVVFLMVMSVTGLAVLTVGKKKYF